MKKRILSLFMAVLMCMSMFSFTASAAAEEVTVSSWNDLISALTKSGTVNITLNKDISYKYDMSKKTTGHTTTKIAGTKTLDLNGHKITCMDESNAVDNGYKFGFKVGEHKFTQCVTGKGNAKTLFDIPTGASLTINDSTNKGGIYYQGKIIDLVFNYYREQHFCGYTMRDLFRVSGTLTINGGKFEAGNQEELTVANGVLLDNYTEKLWGVHINNHGEEQVFGTVATVLSGGKVIINGGTLKGRGITATLQPDVPRTGGILESGEAFTNAISDAAKTFGEDVIDQAKDWIGLGSDDSDTSSFTKVDKDDTETLKIVERDAVIDLQGGSVEINGGKLIAFGGANMFKGATDSNVKITEGIFETDTTQYLRVIDDQYNEGKFYGTFINGKRGDIGITSGMLKNIQDTYVTVSEYAEGSGNTIVPNTIVYQKEADIRALDLKNTSAQVVIGAKGITDAMREVKLVGLNPAKYDEAAETGYYKAVYGQETEFTFDTLALNDEQKETGCYITKSYRILGQQESNISVDVKKSMIKEEGPVKFSYNFPYTGWYRISVSATVWDKGDAQIGSDSYIYYVYAEAKPEKLEVTANPTKTTYKVGDKIDTTGLVLTAYFNDGTSRDVTQWSTLENEEGVNAGQTYYVMKYNGSIATITIKIPITVEVEPDPTEAEPPAITVENKFTDVNTTTGSWYYNDVLLAVQLGLVNGKSAAEYKPGDNITYSEVIKLAAVMHQLYTDGKVTLAPSTGAGVQWYQSYVDYCKTNGIITKEYNYTENATRAGYMVIFAKALPDEALPAINYIPDYAIPDVPMLEDYTAPIYKLYRAGILQGTGDDHRCNPNNAITRAEVACILTRMMYQPNRIKFNMAEPLVVTPKSTTVEALGGKMAAVSVEVEGGVPPYSYQWAVRTLVGRRYAFRNLTDITRRIMGSKKATLGIMGESGTSAVLVCKVTDAVGTVVTSKQIGVSYK